MIFFANNCIDIILGKSRKKMVKYVKPMATYLLISLKIISGVPAITNSESFHLRISY